MRKIESGMERLGTLYSSEKTIAILGDRWWPQTAKQEEGDKIIKKFLMKHTEKQNKTNMSAQMLEVSLSGVGTVLRLGRDAWSMIE